MSGFFQQLLLNDTMLDSKFGISGIPPFSGAMFDVSFREGNKKSPTLWGKTLQDLQRIHSQLLLTSRDEDVEDHAWWWLSLELKGAEKRYLGAIGLSSLWHTTFHYTKTFFEFITLPKTNMTPENLPSQNECNLPTIHFQGLSQFQGGYIRFKQMVLWDIQEDHGGKVQFVTLPETNIKRPWKSMWLERWFISFWGPIGPIFRGKLGVSFREDICI